MHLTVPPLLKIVTKRIDHRPTQNPVKPLQNWKVTSNICFTKLFRSPPPHPKTLIRGGDILYVQLYTVNISGPGGQNKKKESRMQPNMSAPARARAPTEIGWDRYSSPVDWIGLDWIGLDVGSNWIGWDRHSSPVTCIG
jgi:hypothetical protein